MRADGSPAPLALAGALIGLFLGGGLVGGALAAAFAPGSWLAEVVGFFALPLAFAAGLQAWYGLALLSLIPRVLVRLRGRARGGAPASSGGGARSGGGLPGSSVFLPFSSVAGGVAGLLVGLLSATHPVWLVALAYWAVGTAHGALAWRLARAGLLMPPESI